jgi:hypothetical protein
MKSKKKRMLCNLRFSQGLHNRCKPQPARKVKVIWTYLNLTKFQPSITEILIMNVYLEPCNESFAKERADTVIYLAKDK